MQLSSLVVTLFLSVGMTAAPAVLFAAGAAEQILTTETHPVSLASQQDLLTQCWRPEALRAVASEAVPHRGGPGARVKSPGNPAPWSLRTPAALRGSIRRVDLPPGKKLIALTFDLCEAWGEVAGYDGGIVDYLRANHVKATFFTGGKWMETHAGRIEQLMADPLFEIGNHSWTHRNMRRISAPRMLNQVSLAESAYEQARTRLAGRSCARTTPAAMTRVPTHLSLFRFPYGTCNAQALKTVGDSGMLAIQWDVVTGDPDRRQTAKGIARTVLRRARPGSIIVAHANGRGRQTARALAMFVPKLRAKGYRFVTISELLAAGRPVIAQSCYEERPGDNLRY